MCQTEPVKWLVVSLMAVLLVMTGCGRYVDGSATVGVRQVDPSFFFAGEVPVYGQTVSNNDTIQLAYLRAIRRVDICGLVDREALAKIGEITSVGTLFALDECDMDIKLPGSTARKFISVQLELSRVDRPAAFRVDGVPVYASAAGSCEYLIPIDMSHLPGATRLSKPDQPFLHVNMIAETDCSLVERAVRAVAARVVDELLPPRDGAAVYPAALAERDPCEVLAVIAGDVDHWDVSRTRAYTCEFGVWRDGYPDVVPMRVSLEPRIVDITTEGRELRKSDGADVYVDTTFCSAVTFVGPPMQRRMAGGDFVDTSDLVIRSAVVVDSGRDGCAGMDPAVEVAATAAKLYG